MVENRRLLDLESTDGNFAVTVGVTDIFGEDVGAPLGGVFTCSQGLEKAWNTPLDERGIIGMAMGIALAGGKPVAEIQFCDYIFNTIDLLKLAGNSCWSSNGAYPMDMVVVTPSGAGIHGSLYHSHSFDAISTHLAGWKIVMPSTPLDAYGLLLSAIQDPNPVLFMAPKALMRSKGEELIPGEPEDERTLKEMIDAPVTATRSEWKPRWPQLQLASIPLGQSKLRLEVFPFLTGILEYWVTGLLLSRSNHGDKSISRSLSSRSA